MNKLFIAMCAVLCTIPIFAVLYAISQPKPMTLCEQLTWAMINAKTQAERNYADRQFDISCGDEKNE